MPCNYFGENKEGSKKTTMMDKLIFACNKHGGKINMLLPLIKANLPLL
jgi:hypothetical protein